MQTWKGRVRPGPFYHMNDIYLGRQEGPQGERMHVFYLCIPSPEHLDRHDKTRQDLL